MREEYGASVAICSDSQAALKSLSSAKVTSALVAQTVDELQLLSVHNKLRLLWVPGHCDFEGNEKADLLAKQASASSFTGPEPVFGLSITTLRTNLRKWALKEQQISWQQNPGCRQTKLYINGPNPGLAKFALSLRKQDLRLLTGLLTGHVSLNRHLMIMQLRSDPLCPLCKEDSETPLHRLLRSQNGY